MTTNSPSKAKRPIAIAIAGWILFLGAVVNIFIGLLFLVASGVVTEEPNSVIIFADEEADELFTPTGEEVAEGVLDIFLGLVQLVITVGFWRAQRWAWVAAMSWQALKLLVEIAAVLTGGGTFVTILFASAMVFLLNQADVRRAFNIRPQENATSPVTPIRSLDGN